MCIVTLGGLLWGGIGQTKAVVMRDGLQDEVGRIKPTLPRERTKSEQLRR